MSKLVPVIGTHKLSDEEVAALNRELARKLFFRIAIYSGVKLVILLSLRHWAKSVAKNN